MLVPIRHGTYNGIYSVAAYEGTSQRKEEHIISANISQLQLFTPAVELPPVLSII